MLRAQRAWQALVRKTGHGIHRLQTAASSYASAAAAAPATAAPPSPHLLGAPASSSYGRVGVSPAAAGVLYYQDSTRTGVVGGGCDGFDSIAMYDFRDLTAPYTHDETSDDIKAEADPHGPGIFVFQDLTVGEILNGKERHKDTIHSCLEDASVHDAITLMGQHGIGAVLVHNLHGQYTGIMSERDYLVKVALKGLTSAGTCIKEVMTPNPTWANHDATASHCMELMTNGRFRHLPVKRRGTDEVVGMISIRDLVKVVASPPRKAL